MRATPHAYQTATMAVGTYPKSAKNCTCADVLARRRTNHNSRKPPLRIASAAQDAALYRKSPPAVGFVRIARIMLGLIHGAVQQKLTTPIAATVNGAFHHGWGRNASSQQSSVTPSATIPNALLRTTAAARTPARIFHFTALVVSARTKHTMATGSKASAKVCGASPQYTRMCSRRRFSAPPASARMTGTSRAETDKHEYASPAMKLAASLRLSAS